MCYRNPSRPLRIEWLDAEKEFTIVERMAFLCDDMSSGWVLREEAGSFTVSIAWNRAERKGYLVAEAPVQDF